MKRTRHVPILLAVSLLVLVSCTYDPLLIANFQPISAPESPILVTARDTADDVATLVFQTPEEAIVHYLEGVAASDISRILEATAATEVSEGYDLALDVERMGDAFNYAQFLAPSEHEFFSQINYHRIAAQILQQVKLLTYTLLASDQMAGESTAMGVAPELVSQFIQELDPQRLSALEIVKVGSPLKTSDPTYREFAAQKAKVYGADDFTERVGLIKFEEKYYTVGFSLLRYGDGWKISDQYSPLAELNPLGIPSETTVEYFESMILGD